MTIPNATFFPEQKPSRIPYAPIPLMSIISSPGAASLAFPRLPPPRTIITVATVATLPSPYPAS